jgi:hypothetical protein
VLPGLPTAIAVRDKALIGWSEPAPGGSRMRVAILGPAGPGDAPLTLPGGHVRGRVALADAGDRALAAWAPNAASGRPRSRLRISAANPVSLLDDLAGSSSGRMAAQRRSA